MNEPTAAKKTRPDWMQQVADAYSARSRAARTTQGLSPVVTDEVTLKRIASLLTPEDRASDVARRVA